MRSDRFGDRAENRAYLRGRLGRFNQLAKMKTQNTKYMMMRMYLTSMVCLFEV